MNTVREVIEYGILAKEPGLEATDIVKYKHGIVLMERGDSHQCK
ncbi:hypothetical protein TNCT_220991, partial [Trichonephila clavata]